MDIVDKATRSRMMAAVKGQNTKYEVAIRKRLFSKGFRYRINSNKLPSQPDIVMLKYKVVIFVNGCFWHYHKCHLSRIPKTRSEWWQEKLEGNRLRDSRNHELLVDLWLAYFDYLGMLFQVFRSVSRGGIQSHH